MTAYQQVVAAWNAQSDEHNQWDALGEDEKIEWALKCADQFRGATKMIQAVRQEPTRKYLTVVFRDLTKGEAKALIYHEKMSAASWSHALHERDMAKAAVSDTAHNIDTAILDELDRSGGDGLVLQKTPSGWWGRPKGKLSPVHYGSLREALIAALGIESNAPRETAGEWAERVQRKDVE